MRVREADALPVEYATFNHVPHFAQFRHSDFQQRFQFVEPLTTVAQRAQGNLSDDERVHHNLSLAKVFLHIRIPAAQVINPD